jgi:glutamine amidotransferase
MPFAADVTMRAFARRDERNADGWGLAWYMDGSIALVKEATAWSVSGHAAFLQEYERVRSKIFLAHVRRATVGRRGSRANAHPFEREIMGRAYGFEHNGTVRAADLKLGRYRPIGQTDSERLFCHLGELIALRGRHLDEEEDWEWLAETMGTLNMLGKLNALLSDGRRLFAYRDAAGFKGLSMRVMGFHDGQIRRLDDPDLEIDVRGTGGNRVYVVATRPLSSIGWHEVRHGELLVVDAGQLIWSNRRMITALSSEVRQAKVEEG